MTVIYILIIFLCALYLGVLLACWRLRGGRSFGANLKRVIGGQDIGGPDNPPPPPPP